jgi:hypothetical protein
MKAFRWLPAVVASACLSACASGQGLALTGATLHLPTAPTMRPLATTTMYTSPDGGIYQNPDPLDVVLLSRAPAAPIIDRLGPNVADWRSLNPLGDFTFVGVSIRNQGAAGSDLQLNIVQIASDFAPAGTTNGSLRHFYHPMFPLAMLSAGTSDANCSVHVDPGHSALAVLLYPPIRATPSIVWGVFDGFAITVPFGGAVPSAASAWHVTACEPPPAPPSPPAT